MVSYEVVTLDPNKGLKVLILIVMDNGLLHTHRRAETTLRQRS